jgi:hypothetical protein
MLSWLLQNYTFEIAVRDEIVAAIVRRLEDEILQDQSIDGQVTIVGWTYTTR